MVSPAGWFRDFLGFFSVLFLFAGVGVIAVGFGHPVMRTKDDARESRDVAVPDAVKMKGRAERTVSLRATG